MATQKDTRSSKREIETLRLNADTVQDQQIIIHGTHSRRTE